MNLEADNLDASINQDEELVIEPSYVGYLRSEGYKIDGVNTVKVIQSESNPDKAYLLVEIETYAYPMDSDKLDLVADKMSLKCCSCWSYRSNSNDVSEEEVKPGGTCKHIERTFRTEKAKSDPNQEQL